MPSSVSLASELSDGARRRAASYNDGRRIAILASWALRAQHEHGVSHRAEYVPVLLLPGLDCAQPEVDSPELLNVVRVGALQR
jgi:hypothetical protein